MAEDAAYLVIAIVFGLLLLLGAAARSDRVRQQPRPLLPPGSSGLPFLGEILCCYQTPHNFVEQRRKLYGNLFRTCLLGHPALVSTDPEFNKFILQNDGRLFVPRYPSSFRKLLGRWNIGSARGDLHKTLRGAALRFISTSAIKDSFLFHADQTMASRLQAWTCSVMNVKEEAQEMLFCLMVKHIFPWIEENELEKMKRKYYVLRDGLFSLPLKIPGTSYYRSLQKREELVIQIKEIIEKRRNETCSDADVLFSLLKQESQHDLTVEQMVDLCVGMIFGGFDTTTRIMVLSVSHISQNPEVITELRKEHDTIKRSKLPGEGLSWEDYRSMNFTRSVIMETLRVGDGQVNNLLLRQATEDIKVEGGYTIPKGWTCVVYDRSQNTDSQCYKDPLIFNPWRWQKDDLRNVPFAPFGGGPRVCPGRDLAFLIISLFLHHLLTRFKWKQIPSSASIRWFRTPDVSIEMENLED